MKNLISMTDFVLEQGNPSNTDCQFADKVMAYANFLKQPLGLWMLVPCYLRDGVWIPYTKDTLLNTIDLFNEWEQAKERCLFDDYSLEYSESLVEHWKTIEDLVQYNLQLTPTALK